MNISSQVSHSPLATVVNPPTDSLRRENSQREVIAEPAAASRAAAEKGLAADRDRARGANQNPDNIDFAAIQEQAEQETSRINGDANRQGNDQQNQSSNQADGEDQNGRNDAVDESELSPQQALAEEQVLKQLQARDREVRTHEQAHASVGGAVTGSPKYTFERGSDGRNYAVEGEVAVDLSTISGNPEATIAKLEKAYAAALAPASPSNQDRRVAAQAQQLIAKAQAELLAQQTTSNADSDSEATTAVEQSPNRDQVSSTANADITSGSISQSDEQASTIAARAVRVENFYQNINQAYERPSRSQFELTA